MNRKEEREATVNHFINLGNYSFLLYLPPLTLCNSSPHTHISFNKILSCEFSQDIIFCITYPTPYSLVIDALLYF